MSGRAIGEVARGLTRMAMCIAPASAIMSSFQSPCAATSPSLPSTHSQRTEVVDTIGLTSNVFGVLQVYCNLLQLVI